MGRLVVLFILAITGITQGAPPSFGRYVGVLNHDKLGKQQLAKLDFIVSRSSANALELKAILTLHLGDFKSGEYLSFHYDKVRYNVLTGSLSFDDPEQALSVFVKNFSGGDFVGDVTSIWAGRVGQLILSSEKRVTPVKPLIEPVWGEYTGACGDHKTKIQIYTFRSTDDLAHQAQPFASYSIRANLPISCRDGLCVNYRFTSGSYNYFAKKEQLSLAGPRITIKCDVDSNDLRCSTAEAAEAAESGYYNLTDCHFKRASDETKEPRQFSPVENESAFAPQPLEGRLTESELSALQSGEYRGYVFHEYLGVYQAADLTVDVYQAGAGPEGGTRISAHSKLFFGNHDSPEMIPYRFAEKAYPNPVIGPQNLVLSRIDGNMDAVLQITEAKDGVLKGNWYSIIFGRVGQFELRKEGLPKLPENAITMQRLSGAYRGTRTVIHGDPLSQWVIRLMVVPGIKPSATSENPFFPNFMRGSMYLWPVTPSLEITDGSYDFYTGRFGFTKSDTDHGWIGNQVSRKELRLYHVPAGSLTPPPRHVPEVFWLEKELGS